MAVAAASAERALASWALSSESCWAGTVCPFAPRKETGSARGRPRPSRRRRRPWRVDPRSCATAMRSRSGRRWPSPRSATPDRPRRPCWRRARRVPDRATRIRSPAPSIWAPERPSGARGTCRRRAGRPCRRDRALNSGFVASASLSIALRARSRGCDRFRLALNGLVDRSSPPGRSPDALSGFVK